MASAPVYRSEDIRRIEAAAFARAPSEPLMERAGLAAAECLRERLGGGQRVLLLAGPGNNGGDAFVAARHLRQWWVDTRVVFTGTPDRLPPDAKLAFDAWRSAGGSVTAAWPEDFAPDVVADGLFGIGLSRPLDDRHADLVARVAACNADVVALDVPSGLQADTGQALGATFRADVTLTFLALKPGLLTLDGPDHCGEIRVAPLGLHAEGMVPAAGHVIDAGCVRAALPRRRRNAHKGHFGDVGIVGGAAGMAGAAWLAGRAALQLGAGRVFVGTLDAEAPRLDTRFPELMLRPAADIPALDRLAALVVGPGLGRSPAALDLLGTSLAREIPLVLDADALNLVSEDEALAVALRGRGMPTLMTPHPAEAGRLLRATTAEVQADRLLAALRLAADFGALVVLKGAGSVCATPGGAWWINTTGNPGMAGAGMGDVLAGMLGALLAQGAPARDALLAAVHLHGLAGDAVGRHHGGLLGVLASEVAGAARIEANRLVYGGPEIPVA